MNAKQAWTVMTDTYNGFVCGAFDLLHPGHLTLLKNCKQFCSYLIVGLHIDPSIERFSKNKPIQTVYERYLQLAATEYVDKIVPYESEKDLLNILVTLPIHIRFLGDEYQNVKFTGRDLCDAEDIRIHYIKRNHDWSSSELRERLKNAR